jgi:2-polyprenyl-6-methoxyphenol hydroxylase-like FAD-dependent oxidoreductase
MDILPRKPKSAMPLNILIIGAGCAGPAFAHVLEKTNPKHNITIVERFPSLRTAGQQLDLKREGIDIAREMGLIEPFKAVCVNETGLTLVDKNGKSLMRFGVNDSSTGGRNLTNEYEIMRGDMVKVFYDGSILERQRLDAKGENEGSLTYKFDTTVTHLDQTNTSTTVTFSNGQKVKYDLVVAADGQNSRTRRMAFGDEINTKCFRSIGVHAAYFDIPRKDFSDNDARIFFGSNSRMVMTRSGDRTKTQVYFFIMKDQARHERMKSVHKLPIDQQKEAWAEIYRDGGWDCESFVEGMMKTEDFYATELGQVHMPQLHAGRVVLLGDAGYCPTPFTGMGTTLSLIGSHILAGELSQHGDDVEAALQAYHEQMQRPLEIYQKLGKVDLYPSSELGISIINNILWLLSSLKIDKVMLWMGGLLPERNSGWQLPVYPGLNLDTKSK